MILLLGKIAVVAAAVWAAHIWVGYFHDRFKRGNR